MVCSTLTGMMSIKHPFLNIMCREDGAVLSRKARSRSSYEWTYGSLNSGGYLRIKLGKRTTSVHRLIAEAFIDNPENLPEVDHIDRNRQNNCPLNLRWSTHRDNMENTGKVLQRDKRFTIRERDNKKEYHRQKGRFTLTLKAPDGRYTLSGILPQDIYDQLEPLSTYERFIAYHAWKQSLKV